MGAPNLNIPFPKLGVSEYSAYAEQPVQTTPSSKNWVLRDPSTGRARGAQRSGTARYLNDLVGSAGQEVQCLAALNRQQTQVAYAAVNSGNGPNSAAKVWGADVPDERTGDVRAMALDRFGNIYVLCGLDGVIAKYGADGGLVWKHTVKLTSTSTSVYQTLYCIQVDYDGDVYVGVGGTASANNGTVYRFRQVENGLERLWDLTGEFGGLIADIAVEGTYIYIAENTATDFKLHRFGDIKSRDPQLEWTYQESPASGVNTTCTSLVILDDGSCAVSYRYAPTGANTGAVAIISQQGQLLDTYGGTTTTEGGCGYAMDRDEDGNLYCMGQQNSGAGNATDTVVKLTWNGSALARSWGRDESARGMPGAFQGPDALAVDRDGRVYVGLTNGTGGDLIRIAAGGGSVEWQVTILEDVRAIRPDWKYPVPADEPTYGTLGAEFIFVGTDDIGNSGVYGLHKIRMLDATLTDATPRKVDVLAVCNGSVYKAGAANWGSALQDSSAAAITLDTSTRFVHAAATFDRAYFTDGEGYFVYNPNGNSGAGAVDPFRASLGALPERCKLITIWNNRLVLARGTADPFNWYMSAVGDFTDWDFFPWPALATQAVAGNLADAGLAPDIINSLVPYADDLLFFLCDHSIWRMTGDPADGGRVDKIPTDVGGLFGASWCIDTNGFLYFAGSKGGIFKMAPDGSPPVEITNAFIRERLAVLDFSSRKVELVYNDRERAVMVFVMTASGTPTTSEHYQYDIDEGGWWPIAFGSSSHEPLCTLVIDGDRSGADDRKILLGCQDSYVRYWDQTADSDDNGNDDQAIDADIYLGPIVPFEGEEAKLTKLFGILGASSGNLGFTVYGADTPDFNDIGSALVTGTLTAGRTATVNTRARGHAQWLRLRNNTASQRVQIEQIRARYEKGSRVRVR